MKRVNHTPIKQFATCAKSNSMMMIIKTIKKFMVTVVTQENIEVMHIVSVL